MKSIRINIGSGYDITVGSGLIKTIGKSVRALPEVMDASRAVLICDSNVSELYSGEVEMSLKLAGFNVYRYTLSQKNDLRRLGTVEEICSFAANEGMKKGDLFVALGGVVACDLAGMAAALYLGGSAYVSVPTTTLAQVARTVSSVHNADLLEERRILGIRWQPSAVFCDVDTLKTQSKRSRNNGVAEIIRLGCIASDKLISELDDAQIDMEKLIARAITVRSKLALKDERPAGSRPLLRFGSLMCRAIEEVSDYSYDHGEALAIGMVITCAAGERAGIAQVGVTEKLEAILKKHGLPATTNIPAERLLKAVSEDRYITGTQMVLPIIKNIGEGHLLRINTVELRNFFISTLPDWVK